MKTRTTLIASLTLGFLIAVAPVSSANAATKTRAQCEPSCTTQLESCAVQVTSYCAQRETNYQGCLQSAREKCKLGGVKSNGVYKNCISNCMSQQQ